MKICRTCGKFGTSGCGSTLAEDHCQTRWEAQGQPDTKPDLLKASESILAAIYTRIEKVPGSNNEIGKACEYFAHVFSQRVENLRVAIANAKGLNKYELGRVESSPGTTEYQIYAHDKNGKLTHCGPHKIQGEVTREKCLQLEKEWMEWREKHLTDNPGDYPLRQSVIPSEMYYYHPIGQAEKMMGISLVNP